ncbi:hypothetical protein FQA39_LY03303 [Lamprigera yunnana]|nr:hypothetical protein FQA39_LY03303 [Lamprigera yunnana]
MGGRARKIMQLAMYKRESDSNLTKYVTQEVVSIAPSKPHDVETPTEANFRNEIEPQAVPNSYTTNVDDSPYVEELFQDSSSSYAPSEEYGSDMEKAPDEEQESSRLWEIRCHSFGDMFSSPLIMLHVVLSTNREFYESAKLRPWNIWSVLNIYKARERVMEKYNKVNDAVR